MTFADSDEEIEVDSVVGAYMQVRRDALAAVGLLDETFFMYGEDLDWAYRIKQAGWTVFYNPAVTVKHVKRAASRKSAKAQIEFYRAMLIFYRKHYRKTTPMLLHILILLMGSWRRAAVHCGRSYGIRPRSSNRSGPTCFPRLPARVLHGRLLMCWFI